MFCLMLPAEGGATLGASTKSDITVCGGAATRYLEIFPSVLQYGLCLSKALSVSKRENQCSDLILHLLWYIWHVRGAKRVKQQRKQSSEIRIEKTRKIKVICLVQPKLCWHIPRCTYLYAAAKRLLVHFCWLMSTQSGWNGENKMCLLIFGNLVGWFWFLLPLGMLQFFRNRVFREDVVCLCLSFIKPDVWIYFHEYDITRNCFASSHNCRSQLPEWCAILCCKEAARSKEWIHQYYSIRYWPFGAYIPSESGLLQPVYVAGSIWSFKQRWKSPVPET